MTCNSDCYNCTDIECKSIPIKASHSVKWTKELKLTLHEKFMEIYEDDDDDETP